MKILIVASRDEFDILVGLLSSNVQIEAVIFVDYPVDYLQKQWQSTAFPLYTYDYLPVVLEKHEFDLVLISAGKYDTENMIFQQILSLKVPVYKIIPLYGIKDEEMFNLVNLLRHYMKFGQKYKIFATGLSYTMLSISEECYSKPILNLGASNQDLFYDYCLAKSVLSKNNSFEFALLGLAPYSLRYDESRSFFACKCLAYYLMDFNTHHCFLNERMIKELFDNKLTSFFDKIGDGLEEHHKFVKAIRKYETMATDFAECIRARSVASSWNHKVYPETVVENTGILEQYLHLCAEKKVHAVLVVYPVTKMFSEWFNKEALNEFYEIIGKLKQNHEFTFLNFWQDDEFVLEDFTNADHLNVNGARKVSKKIDSILARIKAKDV